MPELHIAKHGEGAPLVLLPPAPHTGAFFAPLLPELEGMQACSVDYPGYGGSAPVAAPSIAAYADAIIPHIPAGAHLLGFHTGTLVAVEIARRAEVGAVVLIDIPAFGAAKRAELADKFSAPNPDRNNDAFLAAFAYDAYAEFPKLAKPVSVIATQSGLLELTREAAALLPDAQLTELLDVTAPAFEGHAARLADTVLILVNQHGEAAHRVRP